MSNLTSYITTFNCGRTPLDVDFFASHLFSGLSESNTTLPPDLLVFCLQEIAPIGQSFLGGPLLSPFFARFTAAVSRAVSQRFGAEVEDYDVLATEHVGMTGIMVFVRPEVRVRIRGIEKAGVGFGHWEMGNKGAVGVRLRVRDDGGEEEDVPITFVAAHLAPAEDQWERRNQDWKSACEGLVFEGKATTNARRNGRTSEDAEPLLSSSSSTTHRQDQVGATDQQSLFSPLSFIIFAGDLNYRTSDNPPSPDAYKKWPAIADSSTQFPGFGSRDQLSRETGKKRTMHHLAEWVITFAPTYKYSSAAQKSARQLASSASSASLKSDDPEFCLWAKHRTPSWCDRILFLSDCRPKIETYTSPPIQPTSDHRPVVLSCSFPLREARDLPVLKPPFAVRADWRQRRAAARRLELVVGVAFYLTMTWEGEALLVGSFVGVLGGYLVLRGLIGS